jgi:hypothetical protein
MSQGRGDRGTRVVIGVAAVAGALTLFYFSATPTVVCAPGAEYVHCTVTARALGLVEVDREQVVDVRSVALVSAAIGGSRTPPRLVFRDATASHDLGYFSQQFAADWEALDVYARRPNAAVLTLTPPFVWRTVSAYAAMAFLGLVGVLTLATALRGS